MMIKTTAMYIGLRTNRCGPLITRCLVGAVGDGVPSPSVANLYIARRSTGSPRAMSMTPTTHAPGKPKDSATRCHPVKSQGTRPETVPGTTIVKSKLHKMDWFRVIIHLSLGRRGRTL